MVRVNQAFSSWNMIYLYTILSKFYKLTNRSYSNSTINRVRNCVDIDSIKIIQKTNIMFVPWNVRDQFYDLLTAWLNFYFIKKYRSSHSLVLSEMHCCPLIKELSKDLNLYFSHFTSSPLALYFECNTSVLSCTTIALAKKIKVSKMVL